MGRTRPRRAALTDPFSALLALFPPQAAEAQLKTLKLNFYPISDRSVVVLKVVPIPQGMPGSIPPPPPPPPVMPVMPGPPPPAAGAPGF